MSVDRKQYSADYYRKNKERAIKRARRWTAEHPEAAKERGKRWRGKEKAANPEAFAARLRLRSREYYQANTEKRRKAAKDSRLRLRREFLENYGNACACCGEIEIAFLTLEHKNRDGAQHRQKFGTTNQQLADLRRRGWPKEDYEILCFNCNRASWEHGVCPHRKGKQ